MKDGRIFFDGPAADAASATLLERLFETDFDFIRRGTAGPAFAVPGDEGGGYE